MEQQPIGVDIIRKAGAGVYTEITAVEAPGLASIGSLVQVRVTIKNKTASAIGIMVGGALEYGVSPWPTISFPNYWANFPAGQSYYFDGTFTMPAFAVVIHAYSYYYGADSSWHFDDEKARNVGLGAEEAQFQSLSVSYAKA
jgi:hypothetical protein